MSSSIILNIIREGQTIKTHPIEGEVVLGRAEGCAIRLDDRAISRQHALFKRVGNQIQVENKSEFAPLSVNGAECRSASIKEGDIISLGPYLIKLTFSGNSTSDKKGEVKDAPSTQESPGGENQNSPSGLEGAADQGQNSEIDNGLNSPESQSPNSNLAENEQNGMSSDVAFGNSPDFQMNESPLESGQESPLEGGQDGAQEDAIKIDQNFENKSEAESQGSHEDEPVEVIDDDAKTKITPTSQVTAQLIFQPDTANVTTFDLNQDEVAIGRGKNCDIILNDKKASRKNSLIRRVGHNFFIKDLESVNGTFVNGVRVQEQELSGDDTIKIGNVEFKLKVSSADYAAKEKNFLSVPAVQEASEPENGLILDGAGELNPANPTGSSTPGSLDPASLPESNDLGAIPGITGISSSPGKKQTLMERFRALPKRTQYIGVVAAVLFLMWLNEDDEIPVIKKAMPKKKPSSVASPTAAGPVTFESLSAEKKAFVEAQHNLAFDYYRNKEYDKAVYEIEKIFEIVPDYKDSREIHRYAKEGRRKMEAIEDERRKKEAEAKLKAKIEQLVEETRIKMEKKQYDQARESFSEILSLDPDNVPVANWKKEIEAIEEQKRLMEQQKQVQEEINKRAWDIFKEATALKKARKYHSAISEFQKAIDVGASDPKLKPLCKKMIQFCGNSIRKLRDPILKQAKEKESSGEFSAAFALFRKATKVDPPHPAGYAGMNRIKGILHDKAKAIYTEAILAESYSDFATAKKLFEECIEAAPPDDVYNERAQRKLAHYFNSKKEENAPQ